MSNILQSVTDLLKKCLEGDPPPPAIIAGLGPRIDQLLAVSVDPCGDGIDRWVNQWQALITDVRLRDTLVVRAVQMNFPRLAEALTLLGIVEFEWDGAVHAAFKIRDDKLNDFI